MNKFLKIFLQKKKIIIIESKFMKVNQWYSVNNIVL